MNPERASAALSGIYMGFLAVVAVLRVEFAQTVALGATIGSIFERGASHLLESVLKSAIPKDFHKWIPVLISYGCRIIGVSIAWTVQRYISAFYSAIRGAQMCVKGGLDYLKKEGHTVPFDETSIIAAAGIAALAFLGFWWQVGTGFSIPFPLNVLLLPLSLLEYFLTWWVAVQH